MDDVAIAFVYLFFVLRETPSDGYVSRDEIWIGASFSMACE